MSLYNMLHGYEQTARIALAMLNLEAGDFGRFRDAWIEEDGKHIGVRTRNGGGNRDDYQGVFERMAMHPLFVSESDDDFDSTYANFTFKIPGAYFPLAERLKPGKVLSLWEKTNQAIDGLKQSVEKAKPEEKDQYTRIKELIENTLKEEREEKQGCKP